MLNGPVVSSVRLSLNLALRLLLGLYIPLQAGFAPALAAVPEALTEATPAPGATAASAATPGSGSAMAPARSGSITATATTQAQLTTIFDDIEKLVMKFYPKAKVTVTNSTMHFECNCKEEEGYYSGRKVLAPQNGGILGDITLESGEYKGKNKDRLPSEVPDGFHTNLTMAPYSKEQNAFLLVHMSYPPDMNVGFKEHFEQLVNNFNAAELAADAAAAKEAASQAAQREAAQKAAAAAAAAQASANAASNNESTFGAPTMSEHRFNSGAFKIQFPDVFQTNHTIQMGLAKVDISAQAALGNFTVSYVIMPDALNVSAASARSDHSEISLDALPTGFAKLETFATGADAAILARMQQRSAALKLGSDGNAAVIRDLNTDLQHMSSPFLHFSAGGPVRRADTALFKGGRAEATLEEYSALFDKLSANLIEQIGGASSQQAVVNLGSFPGRQIVVNSIKGKPNAGALIRIYLCGDYVYELSAVGEKGWLESQAVNRFVNSFSYLGG